MLADRYGLSLSTSSQAACDAYVAGADCVLSAVAGPEAHFRRALEPDKQTAKQRIRGFLYKVAGKFGDEAAS
jgi:hypothetical protein